MVEELLVGAELLGRPTLSLGLEAEGDLRGVNLHLVELVVVAEEAGRWKRVQARLDSLAVVAEVNRSRVVEQRGWLPVHSPPTQQNFGAVVVEALRVLVSRLRKEVGR